MNENPPLKVTDLRKDFPGRKGIGTVHAVSQISFEVRPGEIVGFIGHNGAGKTTTIKCALGLLKPSGGRVSLWGLPPASAAARKRIGYVPENPDYERTFTPMEYMTMFASMRGLDGDEKDWTALLERVGLKGWERTAIRQFSKGMQQRMSLALALQSKPELLVMDEPTGGLDPVARKEFRDIILEENRRGAGIFLSSHILSEVETVCHRAVMLSRGMLIAQGSMDELLGSERTFRLTAENDSGDSVELEVPESALQAKIDKAREKGLKITRVEQKMKTLEEVYIAVSGGGKA
ncbi:MAG TPA: ABC transporter ATP-binding protein [Candidatus Sabulitectum sp.]|nr:ABC transporter ATP-binding protein [Candidatus Sabulitectum sp.]HPJ27583.1 ABC transporter ATP-binding protein [Candidatus Sabulitectum sp.]HPR23230.1 ABC transporter ATP-binding protein [Candidatus Sabulitectum sp.]